MAKRVIHRLIKALLLSSAALAMLASAQIGEETMDHRGITPEDIEMMDAKVTNDEAIEAAASGNKNWGTQKSPEQTEEDKKLMEEWEQHMSDFVPEDITTIQIDPRREVTFYEDIKDENVYVRGAFFVGQSTTSNKLIDFFIVNPKNKVIFNRRKSEEGIFRFNSTIPGRYSFIFSNIKDRKSVKDVTIAIHTPGTSTEEIEQEKQEEQMVENLKTTQGDVSAGEIVRDLDVESIRQSMKKVYQEVRALASEAKMSFIRQDGVNQMVDDNTKSSLYGTLAESLIFVAIAAAQVFYIRNMLEQKRII